MVIRERELATQLAGLPGTKWRQMAATGCCHIDAAVAMVLAPWRSMQEPAPPPLEPFVFWV